MRFFKLSDDEIMVSDGKGAVLIMARETRTVHLTLYPHIELEGHGMAQVCKGCPKAGIIFREYCEECPKEVQPR